MVTQLASVVITISRYWILESPLCRPGNAAYASRFNLACERMSSSHAYDDWIIAEIFTQHLGSMDLSQYVMPKMSYSLARASEQQARDDATSPGRPYFDQSIINVLHHMPPCVFRFFSLLLFK